MAALEAEFAVGGYVFTAFGTDEFELPAALFAELGTFRKLSLALRAFHGFPPQHCREEDRWNP